MKKILFLIILICIVCISGCKDFYFRDNIVENENNNSITVTKTLILKNTSLVESSALRPTKTLAAINESPQPTYSLIITPSPTVSWIMNELKCSVFLETTWGSGPGQFGYDDEDLFAWGPGRAYSNGPYPIQFDEWGNLYVPDHVNNRILVYPQGEKEPEEIKLPIYYQVEGMGANGEHNLSWYNISVGDQKIYLFFQDGRDWTYKLSVMTTSGTILREVDLRDFIEYPPIYLRPVLADGSGGVYIWTEANSRYFTHFDSHFFPKTTIKSSLGSWDFDKMVRGWDGNIYTYGPLDLLRMWGNADSAFGDGHEPDAAVESVISLLDLPEFVKVQDGGILGVDRSSYVYLILRLRTNRERILVIFNMNTLNSSLVTFPEGYLSLSPDGLIYILSFDQEDPDVLPRILKCKLPNQFN